MAAAARDRGAARLYRHTQAFVPMALCVAVFAAMAPRVEARAGAHRSVAFGMLLMVVGLVLFARLGLHVGYTALLPGFMLFGAGAGLMNVPLTNAVMQATPAARAGIAAALLNASREVAGLLGITVIGIWRNDRPGPRVGAVMTTVGIIGSGMIGGTVARLSVAAGHHVVLSNSRGPQTLAELVAELGPLATAATAEQAAEAGDLVVVSIPVKAFGDVPVKPLGGKSVLDTGNYYPQRDGHIEELDTGAVTSSGLLQRDLPESRVVKVFNNIFFKHLRSLARPHGAADRTALPIAGDDEQAKAAVTAFLDSIGYDAVDTGPVAESWRQEPGTPAYGTPYGPFADEAGTPANVATIHAALVGAYR